MSSTVYRDVFGGWRWECQIGGTIRDSQYSYDTREECLDAATRAERAGCGLIGSPSKRDKGALRRHQLSIPSQTVLCVQPRPDLRDSLQRTLHDYDTVIVATAFEALRRFNVSAFDSYVLEYWLPDWSGTQLCREIRRADPNVPIFFYVSAAKDEQRKRALRAGANSYICASTGSRALRQELHTRLQAAAVSSTQARAVEELVIQEELKRRCMLAIPAAEARKDLVSAATERAVTVKARRAFIEAGGTAAYFEKAWRETFDTAADNLQKKYAESAMVGNR